MGPITNQVNRTLIRANHNGPANALVAETDYPAPSTEALLLLTQLLR
jgi:hypothetical protein